ncbi:UNVERIFIED_CONTAM: mRpL34 [Trichonephila clavipes]
MIQKCLSSFWKPNSLLQLETVLGSRCIDQIRTNVRRHWPRPSERKRIRRSGYEKRLSTPGGRAILMRRILKGRFVLSH